MYVCTHMCVLHSLGVEKNNDDAKKNYYSSNKWDAAKVILEKEYKND